MSALNLRSNVLSHMGKPSQKSSHYKSFMQELRKKADNGGNMMKNIAPSSAAKSTRSAAA